MFKQREPGRPRKYGKRTGVLSVAIPPELREKLEAYAYKIHQSVSATTIKIISEFFGVEW